MMLFLLAADALVRYLLTKIPAPLQLASCAVGTRQRFGRRRGRLPRAKVGHGLHAICGAIDELAALGDDRGNFLLGRIPNEIRPQGIAGS